MELEFQLSGRGDTDADKKARHFEAEREMTMKLQHSLQNQSEQAEMIEEQLKEEEKKCKEMLDLKITAEQTLELAEEDAKEMHERRANNREDIIKQRMKLSQLKKQRERLEVEDEELAIKNKETNKENEKLEADNERLQVKIVELI